MRCDLAWPPPNLVMLKEFHNVVLGNGAMPLAVPERAVDDWIAAKLLE